MAVIRGRYISLSRSQQRRQGLEQQLEELGVQEHYSWFPAVSGDAKAAAARGLLAGEWGLWQSWLKLLQEELRRPASTDDWLHILEDDAELSRHFLVFCQQLKPAPPAFDLLFTDMYVNPSIHRSLSKEHKGLLAKGAVQVKTDLYTGCMASVLIHRACIPAVLHCLEKSVNADGPLLPLDNQLRRLFHQQQLRFARTAPFITGVQRESIEHSTIQERKQQDQSVLLTQQICSNLRRQLSVLDSGEPIGELIQLMHRLAQGHWQPSPAELTRNITLQLMHLAEQQKLLRFGKQPRLKREPDNGQYSSQR
jgi:hypothetical protein